MVRKYRNVLAEPRAAVLILCIASCGSLLYLIEHRRNKIPVLECSERKVMFHRNDISDYLLENFVYSVSLPGWGFLHLICDAGQNFIR